VRIIREEIATEYARTVPIIALTANAIVGNEAMFLENGFQAYLPKPIDVILLDALLNQWVRDRHPEAAVQAEELDESDIRNAAAETFAGLGADGLKESFNKESVNIEGLDVEAGSSRFGGKEVYMEVVRSYAAHTPALLDKLRDVREENLPGYAISVHGLKGSSYGICADKVGKMAEELEFAAKKGDIATVREKNGELIRTAEALLSALRSACEETPCEEGGGDDSEVERKSAPDASLLKELRECCVRYDVMGMERALSTLERYTYESQDDLVKWLREQVDNLEYQQILERLEILKC
jgi:CheY-like chemotaxis protein